MIQGHGLFNACYDLFVLSCSWVLSWYDKYLHYRGNLGVYIFFFNVITTTVSITVSVSRDMQ